MIDIYLFEIECAEQIGDYKLADSLDQRLLKMASSNHKDIQKKLQKTLSRDSNIKDVSFSNYQQKFIISAEPTITMSKKQDIKNMAGPFPVSFRYSHKTIDELMKSSPDPMERHIDKFQDPLQDYIDKDDFENIEPTAEDLDFEDEPDQGFQMTPKALINFC